MPGFTSRDDLINELTVNGKRDEWQFVKTAPTTCVVGVMDSLWKGVGSPGAGSDPATTPGTVLTSDATAQTAGSIWFPDRSTDLRFLLAFGAMSTQNGSLILYDRLAGVSGVSLTSTGAKTVNSGALDRYSGTAAADNEVWLEVTTAFTTNSATLNLGSYTAADGTTAQTGGVIVTPVASATLNKLIVLPLSATKQGVRSVEAGITVGGTAPVAGAVNALIVRRLATIPLLANIWNEVSFLDDVASLPQVYDNACLGLAWMANATTVPIVQGRVFCAYG